MNKNILIVLKNNPLSVSEIAKQLDAVSGNEFIQLNKDVNELIENELCFEHEGKVYLSSDYERGSVVNRRGFLSVDQNLIINENDFGLFDKDEIYYEENKYGARCVHVIKRNSLYH